MILEIPTADDFARAGTSALNLAWDVAVALSNRFRIAIELSGYGEDEVSDDYWKRAQQQLGNAVGLVQQGLELGLKSRIAGVSPYLLLLANSADGIPRARVDGVPFSDLRTLDAKDLIRVHDLFCSEPVSEAFCTIFESNRRLRNQFIHGVVKSGRITELQIYSDVLAGYHLLTRHRGKTWAQVRREYLSSVTSESVVDDLQLALGNVIVELNRVIDALPRKFLLDYLDFDKKARRYICPADCYEEMTSSDFRDHLSSDFVPLAQLAPNLPSSTSVFCCACGTTSQVVRSACGSCVGNVLHQNDDHTVCLTCGSEQADEDS